MITAWIFAAITAAWFGVMAFRADSNWLLWACGGALFGLLTTTFVLGLGEAASIPFSNHQAKMFHLKEDMIAAILILGLGAAFTLGLYRAGRQRETEG